MKNKVLVTIMMMAVSISLIACGNNEQAAEAPAQEEQTEEVATADEVEEPLEEDIDEDIDEMVEEESEGMEEDEITEFLSNLYGQYAAYLEEGYDAETDGFSSPISGYYYLSPMFMLADANGDNYDDLIVTGDLGLRDAKRSEIMFYDDNEMTFNVSTFSGCVDSLSEGCVIIFNADRDVATPTYYEDTVIYRLTPSEDMVSEAERVLAHYNVINEENDPAEETDTYYAGEQEISEEEFNTQYAQYEAAIIPLTGFTEMTTDSIETEIPKF